MRRRHLLHAAGTAGVAALAGCSVPGRTTELHSPERTDDERSVYWTFRADGERLSNVGIEYAEPYESGLVPVEFNTWHREGTHLDGFRIEFEFGRRAGKVPPDVYLSTFDSSPDPTIDFTNDADTGTTTLDVPDLGWVGVGSIHLDFLVRPRGWLPAELGVRIRERLSEDGALGGKYVTVVDDRMALDVEP